MSGELNPDETLAALRGRGIDVVAKPTRDAVAAFNELAAEPSKRVVAALHLTC